MNKNTKRVNYLDFSKSNDTFINEAAAYVTNSVEDILALD